MLNYDTLLQPTGYYLLVGVLKLKYTIKILQGLSVGKSIEWAFSKLELDLINYLLKCENSVFYVYHNFYHFLICLHILKFPSSIILLLPLIYYE